MKILVDTNVLVRLAGPGATQQPDVLEAIHRLRQRQIDICIVPQVIYEYWAVFTRPAEQNGLGMTPESCSTDVSRLLRLFQLLRDEKTVFEQWLQLVTSYNVQGKNSHDARLVAAMLRHGISQILTLNPADFSRYAGIVVHTPSSALAGTT